MRRAWACVLFSFPLGNYILFIIITTSCLFGSISTDIESADLSVPPPLEEDSFVDPAPDPPFHLLVILGGGSVDHLRVWMET